MGFLNRTDAGVQLAHRLQKYRGQKPIVFALPRGGVPVAAEVATFLGVTLDLLVVRKIGAPFQPELAVGAICENEDPIWNQQILQQLGLEPEDLSQTIGTERKKIRGQIKLFRESQELPNVFQRTVIVVDDGLATGATMTAAVQFLKKNGSGKIVVAVPVAAEDSAKQLRRLADEVIIIEERDDFGSVGQFYQSFSQVQDGEVVELVRSSRNNLVKSARTLEIPVEGHDLKGDLVLVPQMQALVVFAHGSGSGRLSPRNQMVANFLNGRGFGTLLFDLLTEQESTDRAKVFDIDLLSNRLVSAVKWLRVQSNLQNVPIAFFGASTGAGASIKAAAKLGAHSIYAIVSRGGRPDLAGSSLREVESPTLLLVGGRDFSVIELNEEAKDILSNCKMSIIPEATHLFEEPGTLEEVCRQAADWFDMQLENKNERSLAKRKLSQNLDFLR